jgi:hypothetical protein
LDDNDIVTMVQSLMGAIPDEGLPEPKQVSPGATVLEQVLGLASAGQHQRAPQPDQGLDAGDLLGALLGGGQQSQEPQQQDDGLDIGDVLDALLPAGMAYMQAKRSGADTTAAAGQALMSVIAGGQVNPLQARTPRSAAGGLVAESILRALAGRR